MAEEPKVAEAEHTVRVDKNPLAFSVMRDLKTAGFKILDLQSGRELHALVNLPGYGLTLKTQGSTSRAFGFTNNNRGKQQQQSYPANILMDKKQPPYDVEAVLFLHGTANWMVEADINSLWVLIVADAIDLETYTELIIPIVANYQVDLFVTSMFSSFVDGVRIDLSTVGGNEEIPDKKD